METAADAFKQALQAQTDTLLAIALIVGFGALALIIWRMVGVKQNKINVPSNQPGEPDKIITKDEFIVQMFNDYRAALEDANKFKEEAQRQSAAAMDLSTKLSERLAQADATNEKLAGLLDKLSTRIEQNAKEQADALSLIHKAIGQGVAQATAIRNETVDLVIAHVDTKLREMDAVRQSLMDNLHVTEERLKTMEEDIKSGNSELISKLSEIVQSINNLSSAITELSSTNKETLKANKDTIDKVTISLTDVQNQLVEILHEIVAPSAKEPDVKQIAEPLAKPEDVRPVDPPLADSGTGAGSLGQGTSSDPDHGLGVIQPGSPNPGDQP